MTKTIPVTNLQTDNRVVVTFAHSWPSERDAKSLGVVPMDYYNVVSGAYTKGSTMTIKTLRALGLTVEVLP